MFTKFRKRGSPTNKGGFCLPVVVISWEPALLNIFFVFLFRDTSNDHNYRTFVKSFNENLIFLFLNQNICCGYSKEPSQ